LILSLGLRQRERFARPSLLPCVAALRLPAGVPAADTYVYRALRVNADIGMAAAVGLYQSVVGFVLVFISNWLVKRVNPDRSLF